MFKRVFIALMLIGVCTPVATRLGEEITRRPHKCRAERRRVDLSGQSVDGPQRDNDTWNASTKTLTEHHQAAVTTALAKTYGITWPRQPYLVDAVGERESAALAESPLKFPILYEAAQWQPCLAGCLWRSVLELVPNCAVLSGSRLSVG